jgi:uncharacterized protein
MEIEWDPAKAAENLAKHGVDFADVVDALWDERAVTLLDDYPDEERYVTFGIDSLGRLVAVVYTWRGRRKIRLISARKATRTEARRYAAGEP